MKTFIAASFGLFLALCPFKSGVKSTRMAALWLAGAALIWMWLQWRKSRGGDLENQWLAADIDRLQPLAFHPYLWPLLAILAVSLASAAFGLAPDFSLKQFRKQILYFAVIFLIAWNATRVVGPRGLWIMLWGLTIGGGVSALIGVVRFYDGAGVEVGRATGTLESYTRSAMFFSFHIPVCYMLLLDQLRRGRRRAALIAAGILMLALWFALLSQTRGVWVGTGLALIILTMLSRRWAVAVALIALVLAAAAASPTLRARMNTFARDISRPERLLSGRVEIWRNGWNAISERPLLGIGYGSDIFQQKTVREKFVIDNYKKQPDLHQFYLQLLSEVGALGAIAYLAFAAFWLARALKKLHPRLRRGLKAGAENALSLAHAWRGLTGGLFAILIYGLIGNFYEDHNAMVFWAVIGLTAGVMSFDVPEKPDPEPQDDARSLPA